MNNNVETFPEEISDEIKVFLDNIIVENKSLKLALDRSKKELSLLQVQTIKETNGLKQIADRLKEDDQLLASTLNRSIISLEQLVANWEIFKMRFEEAYPTFVNNLVECAASLTAYDLQLCYLLKMKMSSKDIAEVLHISPRSVDMSRYRVRKKLNLNSSIKLHDFLIKIPE
jgi:AraC family chitin signaling transcriptional activator